jgi:hypothetical protein
VKPWRIVVSLVTACTMMPRTRLAVAAAVVSCALFACNTAPTPQPVATGADRDKHGCLPSAGYSWCEHTRQCERPWELAAKAGFENSRVAFDLYCGKPSAM